MIACLMYSKQPFIFLGPFHPQPKDALWHGDNDDII